MSSWARKWIKNDPFIAFIGSEDLGTVLGFPLELLQLLPAVLLYPSLSEPLKVLEKIISF